MRLVERAFAPLVSILVGALPALAQEAPTGPRAYGLDSAHSHVEFRVGYLKLMTVEGRFREWSATVVNPENPTDGAVAIVLRTASLDTGNETRDEHLRSPDFFDAERYPAIVFTSDEVVPDGDGFVARGTLEMHGTRREIEVPFEPAYEPTTDAKGNRRAGFTGETAIDRKAFGIAGGNRFNEAFDPRVSLIDDEVTIRYGIHVMISPIESARVDSLVSAVRERGIGAAVGAWNAEFPPGEGDEVERSRMRMAGLYNAAGYVLLRDGAVEDAVELLRLAVLGAPRSARARSGLAEGYARAGMWARARDAVRQTLEIDPYETRALALEAWLEER